MVKPQDSQTLGMQEERLSLRSHNRLGFIRCERKPYLVVWVIQKAEMAIYLRRGLIYRDSQPEENLHTAQIPNTAIRKYGSCSLKWKFAT